MENLLGKGVEGVVGAQVKGLEEELDEAFKGVVVEIGGGDVKGVELVESLDNLAIKEKGEELANRERKAYLGGLTPEEAEEIFKLLEGDRGLGLGGEGKVKKTEVRDQVEIEIETMTQEEEDVELMEVVVEKQARPVTQVGDEAKAPMTVVVEKEVVAAVVEKVIEAVTQVDKVKVAEVRGHVDKGAVAVAQAGGKINTTATPGEVAGSWADQTSSPNPKEQPQQQNPKSGAPNNAPWGGYWSKFRLRRRKLAMARADSELKKAQKLTEQMQAQSQEGVASTSTSTSPPTQGNTSADAATATTDAPKKTTDAPKKTTDAPKKTTRWQRKKLRRMIQIANIENGSGTPEVPATTGIATVGGVTGVVVNLIPYRQTGAADGKAVAANANVASVVTRRSRQRRKAKDRRDAATQTEVNNNEKQGTGELAGI